MKLDVEGAELGALRGLSLTGGRRPVIVFELGDWAEARIGGRRPAAFVVARLQSVPGGTRGRPDRPLARPITTGSAMILALPSRAEVCVGG